MAAGDVVLTVARAQVNSENVVSSSTSDTQTTVFGNWLTAPNMQQTTTTAVNGATGLSSITVVLTATSSAASETCFDGSKRYTITITEA
jgi:hypothetical protein